MGAHTRFGHGTRPDLPSQPCRVRPRMAGIHSTQSDPDRFSRDRVIETRMSKSHNIIILVVAQAPDDYSAGRPKMATI